MKLYIECNMGLAGDMLIAALSELFDDRDQIIAELNSMGIEGVTFSASDGFKCGIKGTSLSVTYNGIEEGVEMFEHHHDHVHDHHHHHDDEEEHEHHHHHDDEDEHEHHHHHHHDDGEHEHHHHHHDHDETDHEHHHHDHDHDHGHGHHHHASLADVKGIINGLAIPEEVKKNACAVYDTLAAAEASVHGTTIDQIHFHEVGTMDAVADITAVSYLLNKLQPEEIIVSPIHVGRGFVKCAHGILPVPAPATAYLLKDVPIYSKELIEGELCTPTGAALARYYATSFGYMPVMQIKKTGYGLGKKDFPAANLVRVILGENSMENEKIVELDTNLDDMTGEEISFATEEILKAGANEVFTTNVNMKKNRPGILLTVLCEPEKKDEIIEVIFKNTTTLGVRQVLKDRSFLQRKVVVEQTGLGEVRNKMSSGFNTERSKYEYDDLARIARESGLSLLEVKKKLG